MGSTLLGCGQDFVMLVDFGSFFSLDLGVWLLFLFTSFPNRGCLVGTGGSCVAISGSSSSPSAVSSLLEPASEFGTDFYG